MLKYPKEYKDKDIKWFRDHRKGYSKIDILRSKGLQGILAKRDIEIAAKGYIPALSKWGFKIRRFDLILYVKN